jgi:hypothetical protein
MLVDRLDKELYRHGKVAVKSPDVWGQNRMTQYRAEFEDQMSAELKNFQLTLQAYQRRSDDAALTSATTVAAAVQPRGAAAKAGTATTTTVQIPSQPGIPGDLVDNAKTLIGTITKDLTPSDLSGLTLANTGAGTGIGLEPTIVLDQKARYLNHLHELRRINAGADSADTPGYGLYLMRMPVSLLPGPQSQRGKGALVTVEAKFEPTTDLLPVTFRNVVVLDTTYQLKDFLIKALHKTIDLSKDAPSQTTNAPRANGSSTPKSPGLRPMATASLLPNNTGTGRVAISTTEIIDVYGRQELRKLYDEIAEDEKDWYRHDPSVVSWLIGELTTAHNFIRDEARRGNTMFQPAYVQAIGELAFERRFQDLRRARAQFLCNLINTRKGQVFPSGVQRPEYYDVIEDTPEFYNNLSVVDVLTFGLMVQSYYLDRTIKVDMEVMARRKGCTCGDPWGLTLYEPDPSEEARTAFAAYVACKWPIHVFAVDPTVDQQNQLDLFSQRSVLQLALAVSVATGQVNFNNATTYARRLETDLATIALNRTAVGFGAGDTTFGWRFYPRVQTPPTPSNPARFLGLLANNGTGPDYDLKHRRIEPGPRECVALVVAPNFVPQIKLTSTSNWFDLAGHHSDQTMETTDMVRMARKLQKARAALIRLCDTHEYPPNQMELLADRLSQLEAMLPMRSHQVALPFEGDLTASEIFSSTSAGLAPRLLTWYGEPPKVGVASSIFLVGTGFSVHELKTIVGGVTLPDTDMISRNVVRIDIPATARAITTNPNLDGVRRLVFDVHVATPNGVSNHMLVEAEPADQPPGPAPPQYAYTINAKTTALSITYNAKNASGNFQPNNGQVDGSTPRIQILWNDPTGIAPRQIQVSLNLHYKGGSITIPLARSITLSGTDRGVYAITGADLDLVAKEYVEQLDSLDNFTLDNPLPSLTTDSIDITPVSDGKILDTQMVHTNNQLTINPSPIGTAPPTVPAVVPAPAPTNLTPLPPDSASRVRSLVSQGMAESAATPVIRDAALQRAGVPSTSSIPLIPSVPLIPSIPGIAALKGQQPLLLSPSLLAPAPVTTTTTTVVPATPATPAPPPKHSILSRLRHKSQ